MKLNESIIFVINKGHKSCDLDSSAMLEDNLFVQLQVFFPNTYCIYLIIVMRKRHGVTENVTFWESVLFLFVVLFIYYYSLSVSVISAFCHVLAVTSLVTSLCLCLIWARTHPESASALFGYSRVSGIFIELHSLLVFWKFSLLP